jgi:hypothetical protein
MTAVQIIFLSDQHPITYAQDDSRKAHIFLYKYLVILATL